MIINGEKIRIRKETILHYGRYCPGIYLERMKKTIKILYQNIRYRGQDLIQTPLNYTCRMLLLS